MNRYNLKEEKNMLSKDPEKKARNKRINDLTDRLKELLPKVLSDTGILSEQSLHAKYGGKHADYIDINHAVINSSEHFVSLYLSGFKEFAMSSPPYSSHVNNFELLRKHESLRNYLFLFLKRTYYRQYEALSKKRPHNNESEYWIGQNNANYGILVTPRFNYSKQQWENDKSEIRHFKAKYWTIGHILETGLCIPDKEEKITFSDVNQYLTFFLNTIVRNSGSQYEYDFASLYVDYVKQSKNPFDIPLLIPELRFGGLTYKHKYRLDFCLIEQSNFNKIGIELSPWSSHGHLNKTKDLSQKDINAKAKSNFEKEMKKHKDFFRELGIFVMIYTDSDLKEIQEVFHDIEKYLRPSEAKEQLQYHIIDEILK
jgi:hypothetical protein